MTGGQLMEELVYYGVSAISLSTTGSNQQGLRACTSFIKDHQYDLLDERLEDYSRKIIKHKLTISPVGSRLLT